MAYKKAGEAATKNGIAELAKRVPPNQALKFKDFQAKHLEYRARVNRQPEKLPSVDWEYYKRYVRADFVKMVEEFEQKYKSVCEAFDNRQQENTSKYFVEIDRLKEQVQQEFEQYKAASNERIRALEEKYNEIQAMIPYEEMTAEEYAELLPDKSFYRYKGQPSFWPHTPDEQGPGPSVQHAHAHDGEGGGGGGGHDGSGGSGQDGSGSSGSSGGGGTTQQSTAKSAYHSDAAASNTQSTISASKVEVSSLESTQFKKDLENLKKCLEDAAEQRENLKPKTLVSNGEQLNAQQIEQICHEVIAAIKTTQAKTAASIKSTDNESTNSILEKGKQKLVSHSKVDLPDLSVCLEELSVKAAKETEPATMSTALFKPVAPAIVSEVKLEAKSAEIKNAAVENMSVKVFSPTAALTKPKVIYTEYALVDLNTSKICVSTAREKQKTAATVTETQTEFANIKPAVQLLKDAETTMLKIDERDATKDLQRADFVSEFKAFEPRKLLTKTAAEIAAQTELLSVINKLEQQLNLSQAVSKDFSKATVSALLKPQHESSQNTTVIQQACPKANDSDVASRAFAETLKLFETKIVEIFEDASKAAGMSKSKSEAADLELSNLPPKSKRQNIVTFQAEEPKVMRANEEPQAINSDLKKAKSIELRTSHVEALKSIKSHEETIVEANSTPAQLEMLKVVEPNVPKSAKPASAITQNETFKCVQPKVFEATKIVAPKVVSPAMTATTTAENSKPFQSNTSLQLSAATLQAVKPKEVIGSESIKEINVNKQEVSDRDSMKTITSNSADVQALKKQDNDGESIKEITINKADVQALNKEVINRDSSKAMTSSSANVQSVGHETNTEINLASANVKATVKGALTTDNLKIAQPKLKPQLNIDAKKKPTEQQPTQTNEAASLKKALSKHESQTVSTPNTQKVQRTEKSAAMVKAVGSSDQQQAQKHSNNATKATNAKTDTLQTPIATATSHVVQASESKALLKKLDEEIISSSQRNKQAGVLNAQKHNEEKVEPNKSNIIKSTDGGNAIKTTIGTAEPLRMKPRNEKVQNNADTKQPKSVAAKESKLDNATKLAVSAVLQANIELSAEKANSAESTANKLKAVINSDAAKLAINTSTAKVICPTCKPRPAAAANAPKATEAIRLSESLILTTNENTSLKATKPIELSKPAIPPTDQQVKSETTAAIQTKPGIAAINNQVDPKPKATTASSTVNAEVNNFEKSKVPFSPKASAQESALTKSEKQPETMSKSTALAGTEQTAQAKENPAKTDAAESSETNVDSVKQHNIAKESSTEFILVSTPLIVNPFVTIEHPTLTKRLNQAAETKAKNPISKSEKAAVLVSTNPNATAAKDNKAIELHTIKGEQLKPTSNATAAKDTKAIELHTAKAELLKPTSNETAAKDGKAFELHTTKVIELHTTKGELLKPTSNATAAKDTKAIELHTTKGELLKPASNETVVKDIKAIELHTTKIEVLKPISKETAVEDSKAFELHTNKAIELNTTKGELLKPTSKEAAAKDTKAIEFYTTKSELIKPTSKETAAKDTTAIELHVTKGEQLKPISKETTAKDSKAIELHTTKSELLKPNLNSTKINAADSMFKTTSTTASLEETKLAEAKVKSISVKTLVGVLKGKLDAQSTALEKSSVSTKAKVNDSMVKKDTQTAEAPQKASVENMKGKIASKMGPQLTTGNVITQNKTAAEIPSTITKAKNTVEKAASGTVQSDTTNPKAISNDSITPKADDSKTSSDNVSFSAEPKTASAQIKLKLNYSVLIESTAVESGETLKDAHAVLSKNSELSGVLAAQTTPKQEILKAAELTESKKSIINTADLNSSATVAGMQQNSKPKRLGGNTTESDDCLLQRDNLNASSTTKPNASVLKPTENSVAKTKIDTTSQPVGTKISETAAPEEGILKTAAAKITITDFKEKEDKKIAKPKILVPTAVKTDTHVNQQILLTQKADTTKPPEKQAASTTDLESNTVDANKPSYGWVKAKVESFRKLAEELKSAKKANQTMLTDNKPLPDEIIKNSVMANETAKNILKTEDLAILSANNVEIKSSEKASFKETKEAKQAVKTKSMAPNTEQHAAAAKPSKPNKALLSSKIVDTNIEPVESIFKDSGFGFLSASVKGLQVKVITSHEFFEPSGTKVLTFRKKDIKVEPKNVSNESETKLKRTKEHEKVKAAGANSEVQQNPPLASKHSNTDIKTKAEFETSKSNPPANPSNPTNFKGFTLIGMPQSFKDLEENLTRSDEIFKAAKLVKDHINAIEHKNADISKAPKETKETEESFKNIIKNTNKT